MATMLKHLVLHNAVAIPTLMNSYPNIGRMTIANWPLRTEGYFSSLVGWNAIFSLPHHNSGFNSYPP